MKTRLVPGLTAITVGLLLLLYLMPHREDAGAKQGQLASNAERSQDSATMPNTALASNDNRVAVWPQKSTKIRHAVSGTLQTSSMQPLSANGLLFSFDGGETRALTDLDGKFFTEAVIPTGFVRVTRDHGNQGQVCDDLCDLEPKAFLVYSPDDNIVQRVDLVVRKLAVLRISVTKAGAPAAGLVSWNTTKSLCDTTATSETNLDGRLALDLCGLQEGSTVTLMARAGPLKSRAFSLEFPWRLGAVDLALMQTGSVRVVVLDQDRRPVPHASVRFAQGVGHAITDAGGSAVISDVVPGPNLVVVQNQLDHTWIVDVPEGGDVSIECVVRSDDSTVLVDGYVLDGQERPLPYVRVSVRRGETWLFTSTQLDGHFELSGRPGEPGELITVVAGGRPEDERYAPEKQNISVGARGIIFHQWQPVEDVAAAFVLLDAVTRRHVNDANVIFYRELAPGIDCYKAKEGMLTLSIKPHGDMVVLARAHGFRDQKFSWADLSARNEEVLQLMLSPGVDMGLKVIDQDTSKPIEGAEVSAGEVTVGITGTNGAARIVMDAWPKSLYIRANGYLVSAIQLDEIPCEPIVEASLTVNN